MPEALERKVWHENVHGSQCCGAVSAALPHLPPFFCKEYLRRAPKLYARVAVKAQGEYLQAMEGNTIVRELFCYV